MLKDRMSNFIKLLVLIPLFVTAVILWIPFMIFIKLYIMAADDVNNFFNSSSKSPTNVLPLKKK